MKTDKNHPAPDYLLGSPEQQAWMRNYFFAPRGIGFLEPGVVALDDAKMSAYNVAKSSYQIRPDVFNMAYLAKEVGLGKAEIMQRIQRMYDQRAIMFVMNPAVAAYGWGLYYWLVKLNGKATPETKAELSRWFQDKDDICTGYECHGDFDFFNGNHMRVLDNLLADVIEPWKHRPEVDYVHLCPIRRDLRESHVNMWDCPGDGYRESVWGPGQLERLAKLQDRLDLTDLRIVQALNKKRPMEDYFDYQVLAEISGLDEKAMLDGIKELVESKRIIVPLVHLNFMKLGLTNRVFIIRLFQNIPCCRKAQVTDELFGMGEFNTVMEFSDSFYDIVVWAYNELTDIPALRRKLESYSEIEEIKEADMTRMFRRWVCRLDEENGYWEECVFTDDFLQDRTPAGGAATCRLSRKEVK